MFIFVCNQNEYFDYKKLKKKNYCRGLKYRSLAKKRYSFDYANICLMVSKALTLDALRE